MPRGENRIMINFRLPPDLVDRLKRVADEERRSVTKTVEVALGEYLDRFDRRKRRSSEGVN